MHDHRLARAINEKIIPIPSLSPACSRLLLQASSPSLVTRTNVTICAISASVPLSITSALNTSLQVWQLNTIREASSTIEWVDSDWCTLVDCLGEGVYVRASVDTIGVLSQALSTLVIALWDGELSIGSVGSIGARVALGVARGFDGGDQGGEGLAIGLELVALSCDWWCGSSQSTSERLEVVTPGVVLVLVLSLILVLSLVLVLSLILVLVLVLVLVLILAIFNYTSVTLVLVLVALVLVLITLILVLITLVLVLVALVLVLIALVLVLITLTLVTLIGLFLTNLTDREVAAVIQTTVLCPSD